MNNSARRATAVVGAIAATALVALPAAGADTVLPSRVTATATDPTPAAGQAFRVFGAVWSAGERVPATVRVKMLRDGVWVQIPGAVVQTNSTDRYRVRLVLQKKGERQLRVVGDPTADGIATARRLVTVTVH